MDALDSLSAAFPDPELAARVLGGLSKQLGEERARTVGVLAAQGFDPDALLFAFDRIAPALRRVHGQEALGRTASLLKTSAFLARVLAQRPALLGWILRTPTLSTPRTLTELRAGAKAAVRRVARGDLAGLKRALRRFKTREQLRLIARDVWEDAPLLECGAEMSRLAQAVLEAALATLDDWNTARFGTPPSPGFCVLGLGKLGGGDLNFSSDIDLIYFYRADGQTASGQASSELYRRLGEQLTQVLSETTADGFCFRVDVDLRPHGRGGPLVRSLAQMLAYYESSGRTWERAALIKARPVAGDVALGAELLDALRPFVYPRSLDLSAVEALRGLKGQIDLKGKGRHEDVKLGRGGIREIEFFVNALQLVHGGKDPGLREPNTLRGLSRIVRSGLVSDGDARRLSDAYVFLRRVENRLQMREERQTHTLPEAPRELLRLAKGLGFKDTERFFEVLDAHRDFVNEAFVQLLGQAAREDLPDEPLLVRALDLEASREAREAALTARGFREPARALEAFTRLSRVRGSPFQEAGPGVPAEAVRLLSALADTPDPDQALMLFSEFLQRLQAPQGYLKLLTRSPRSGRRLFHVLGSSEYLSRALMRLPQLLDTLLQGSVDAQEKTDERIRDELAQRMVRTDDPEESLVLLRRFKNEETLRVGLADISGELSVPSVAAQLTSVADATLDHTLYLAAQEQRERHGEALHEGQPGGLTVIALGKLGGRELGYHSDLDLLFVYEGDSQAETTGGTKGPVTLQEYYARLVQRLLALLQMSLSEGFLYKVDARLRPSGNQGTLVVNQQSFHEHHSKRAQLWERQAMVKARMAAGDPALWERLARHTLVPLVYERPLPPDAAAEIARLRLRMERELARESSDTLDVKLGQGGLVDVEFATQYLQLLHGGRFPAVRTPNTLQALRMLAVSGVLGREDADTLYNGYLFLRRVETRLRLVHGAPISRLPTAGPPLEQLARRLGELGPNPGEIFLERYRACAGGVRAVYARLLDDTGARAAP